MRRRALFGKKDITTEWVDLNEATRDVIAVTLSELQGNRVVLRLELADDLPIVTGDRVQLQQDILNLIRNASDAMSAVEDRPRQLRIGTGRDDGDCVRLTVQDAGLGFDPQGVDRLFDAFYIGGLSLSAHPSSPESVGQACRTVGNSAVRGDPESSRAISSLRAVVRALQNE